jgi:hypothetical protein
MAGDDSELDFARFLEQVAANSAKVVETIVGMLTQ